MNNHKEELRVAGIAVGVYVAFSLLGAMGRKVAKVWNKVAEELNDMAIEVTRNSPLGAEVIMDPAKSSEKVDPDDKKEKPSE